MDCNVTPQLVTEPGWHDLIWSKKVITVLWESDPHHVLCTVPDTYQYLRILRCDAWDLGTSIKTRIWHNIHVPAPVQINVFVVRDTITVYRDQVKHIIWQLNSRRWPTFRSKIFIFHKISLFWLENHCVVSSEYVLNRFNHTHYVPGSFCDGIQG